MRTLREEHAKATRDAIVLAARKLFTSKGYDASAIDEVAAAARVTSGALYHHFGNKREIMRAVFEALEAELKARISAAAGGTKSAAEAMRLTLRALFDACLEDDIRSIVFEQAPIDDNEPQVRPMLSNVGFSGHYLDGARIAEHSGIPSRHCFVVSAGSGGKRD